MMQIEFGEKLKACREEKGMTQQTLADKLYVTRQAVSRWECGARYPDLITAKRIAEELEISLDELVSGEKYIRNIEREPVITAPVPLLIQTALYAAVCMSYLVMCLYDIGVCFPYAADSIYGGDDVYIKIYFAVMIGGTFIKLPVMGAGLYYSVRNELSPRQIGWIMSVPFFVEAATMVMAAIDILPMLLRGNGTLTGGTVFRFVFYCIVPFVLFGFFHADKSVDVKYTYAVVCILAVIFLADIGNYTSLARYDGNRKDIASVADSMLNQVLYLIRITGKLAYLWLLASQVYMLNRKRKAVL